MTNKEKNENLRMSYLKLFTDLLIEKGEEVLRTNSNEIAVPVVDDEKNEKFIVITFKVPTGSRDGEAYDGYSVAEDYKFTCEEKAQKNKEAAEKKAKKIEADKKAREERKRLREAEKKKRQSEKEA